MKNQNGFTLIELVVVIVILGILAAVAVPKFVDMQVDARVSAVTGMYAAVQSATALVHAQALVKGRTAATGQIIKIEGTDVALEYGYPSLAGIRAAVNIDGFSYNTGVFTLNGAPTPASCSVTYVAATSATAPATSTKNVAGCE